MEGRATHFRLRRTPPGGTLVRALAGGALVFTLGLGIGTVAGSLSEVTPRSGGTADDAAESRRSPASVPASRERRAEVPLIFVAFDAASVDLPEGGSGFAGFRWQPALADGEPWML